MKPDTRGWWIGRCRGRTIIVDVHRSSVTGNLCAWLPGKIMPYAAWELPGNQWRRIDMQKLKFKQPKPRK